MNNEWFNNLERREQWILMIGAVFVAFYLLYALVLSPLDRNVIGMTLRNQGATEVLQWLHQGAAEIKQLRDSGLNTSGASISLSKMVDDSAARSGIRVSRFQPNGDNEAQVWLDKVAFNQLLTLLDRMENTYGASVENISVNGANEAGMVNARVRFKLGA